MDNKIKVSVIVPTYNRPQLLLNTIISLKEQYFSDYEIIVVDNASLEDTRVLVEKVMNDIDIGKCSIRYIDEPNIGLHNARHTGAKTARGGILIYLDDDLIAEKNYLSEIYEVFQEIPNAGWVGGKILPKWEIKPPAWINYFPSWYLSLYDEGDELKEVQWIYGSIRKDLFFKLGGFNPDAFGDKKMWWMRGDGEIGLLRKVHNAGKKVIYNPKAIVWHFIPKERLTVEYFQERAFKSGIEESFKKYRYDNFGKLNPLKLMIHSIVFGMYYMIYTIIARSLFLLKNKSYYNCQVFSSYYKARFLYELKIATDRNLQKFVKKETWLE